MVNSDRHVSGPEQYLTFLSFFPYPKKGKEAERGSTLNSKNICVSVLDSSVNNNIPPVSSHIVFYILVYVFLLQHETSFKICPTSNKDPFLWPSYVSFTSFTSTLLHSLLLFRPIISSPQSNIRWKRSTHMHLLSLKLQEK